MMKIPTEIGEVIYLDNAATVFPKPPEVLGAMVELYSRFGVNPGRSGYDLCLVGGDLLQQTRARLTRFFGGGDPDRLCFTANASDALNILIQGMVRPADHVISTTVEHNSVIRPLNHLKRDCGVEVEFVPCAGDGTVDPDDIHRRFTASTRLVVVNHGSNVIGTVQPVAEIGRLCREHEVPLVVDTAQTAGMIPIDMGAMGISAIAFTGHKSLLGPMGIGGLCVGDGVRVSHTRFGGTGVHSAFPFHLEEYPYRLEVGTPNVLGIIGLGLAQDYLERRGVGNVYHHEMELFERLQTGLAEISGVRLHGTTRLHDRLPVLSLTVDGLDPSDVGTMLDVDHDIACRTGLQCAPLIHEQMGTAPRGTVRLSLGPGNREADVEAAVAAVAEIAASTRPGRG